MVGTKLDLPVEYREVTSEEATQFAIDNKMLYFETSAKNNQNVKEAIEFICFITL